ncbi:hypothetical protein M378DRAFT_8411 [Amanita muscaria Koide BX008]|uniref:Uncharacterized protein n=1 Tax=Amanita muscaria (strain Koide BX008) TaxID=946122 RepID=A0A0C2XJ39_AMAMK|nr:hypothetical protein M378DRAFT_8411 [Amanita muscaria Koide BX008]
MAIEQWSSPGDIDKAADNFRDTIEKAWTELSVIQKSKPSPSWWNEELSLLSKNQKASKSKESVKAFRDNNFPKTL